MTVDMEARLIEYPVGTELERTCIGCGESYMWTSEPGRQRATIYCSKRCRRRGTPERRVKRILLTEDVPVDDLRLLICARCWLPFGWEPYVETSDNGGPLYHSRSCRDKAHRERQQARRTAEREGKKQTREQAQARAEAEEAAANIAAISAAARELLLPATHCVTCGKVASPTEEAAKEAKRAIEAKAGRTNSVRYYQCADGWWHWTRMDATLDGFRARQAELLMTEIPASLRHRGRGGWTVPR